jgi:hypothetical protein
VLSETNVRSQWRNLFESGNVTPTTLDDAQQLLDELPLTSPLRTRLTAELDEIRRIHDSAGQAEA